MNSPAAPFKLAQEAGFRAAADLAAAMGGTVRLYTEVPEGAPLPYVVNGNDQVILEDTGCGVEAEVFSTVTLWSRTTPALDKGAQARAIGAALIAAAEALTVEGWDVDLFELTSERYSTDPDQSTRGVIEFRHLLTEQAA